MVTREREHLVQFYDDDAVLMDSVYAFFRDGFRCGERAVLIAQMAHRAGIEERLRSNGFDVAELLASGHYTPLDAGATLERILVDGMPDRERFRSVVGALVADRPLRAFGEMVALLWSSGRREAALRLEELWNELLQERAFALFCAYPLRIFDSPDSIHHVCGHHTLVFENGSLSTSFQQHCLAPELGPNATFLQMAVGLTGLGTWELDLGTATLIASPEARVHLGIGPFDEAKLENLPERLRSAIQTRRDFLIDLPGVRCQARVLSSQQRVLGVTLPN